MKNKPLWILGDLKDRRYFLFDDMIVSENFIIKELGISVKTRHLRRKYRNKRLVIDLKIKQYFGIKPQAISSLRNILDMFRHFSGKSIVYIYDGNKINTTTLQELRNKYHLPTKQIKLREKPQKAIDKNKEYNIFEDNFSPLDF